MDTNSSDTYCNTNQHKANQKNFFEYPIKLLKFTLKKLKIKELLSSIHDPRTRVDNYSLLSLLMHGLLTHLFRSPSKNEFRLNLLRPEASRAVAKFTGIEADKSPCTRTLDDVLININPKDFESILPAIFKNLCRQKTFLHHPEFIPQGEYSITIDAQVTHVYYEHSQHPCCQCNYCLKRTRGERVWYLHYDLVASFVAPNNLKIPLLSHRIRARPEWGKLSDEEWKQECELTAFPQLITKLRHYFPRLRLCILLDSLYATDPNFTLLKKLKLGFAIVKKATVLKTVGEDYEGLKALSSSIKIIKKIDRFNIQQNIHFCNDIQYRKHNLHLIEVEEHGDKKPSKRFAKITTKDSHWQWLVHEVLDTSNVYPIATRARLRWKGEDLFNDLQKRGFGISHDYNRAPNAQTIRIYFILIAYAICSIMMHSKLGQAILADGRRTIIFTMKQMLQDLIYLSQYGLLDGYNPVQLRFGKDPPN
jgi:hypothetical protein